MAEEWDWELQQAQTAYTVAKILEDTGIAEGSQIGLDLEFLPVEGADEAAFIKVLKTFGYEAEPSEDGEINVTVEAELSFDSIWTHEERTTKMALSRGYQPDGWGFWEP